MTNPKEPIRIECLKDGVALSGDDLEWLDSLPGKRAEHIRKAITLYRQQWEVNSGDNFPSVSS